jgi:hypothetical protein
MPYLTELKALAERLDVIHPNKAQGCTEEEIESLEDALHIKLPAAYREFLAWCGKRAGDFLSGSQWQYDEDDLILFQEDAKEVLDDKNFSNNLPANAYVFFMHLDYQFCLFLLEDGGNPPIHMFLEGKTVNEFHKEFCSFTEFLEFRILVHQLIKNNSVQENLRWLWEQYSPCTQ